MSKLVSQNTKFSLSEQFLAVGTPWRGVVNTSSCVVIGSGYAGGVNAGCVGVFANEISPAMLVSTAIGTGTVAVGTGYSCAFQFYINQLPSGWSFQPSVSNCNETQITVDNVTTSYSGNVSTPIVVTITFRASAIATPKFTVALAVGPFFS